MRCRFYHQNKILQLDLKKSDKKIGKSISTYLKMPPSIEKVKNLGRLFGVDETNITAIWNDPMIRTNDE